MTSSRGNFYEEEIDDDEFLRHPKSGTAGYMLPQTNQNSNQFGNQRNLGNQFGNQFGNQGNQFGNQGNPFGNQGSTQDQNLEAQRQELQMRRREIEMLILFRTEQRLDDINSTLRNSEKHIQGIRSVFGSIRNYFSGRPTATTAPAGGSPLPPLPPSQSAPQFSSGGLETLHQDPGYQDHHPGLRNKPGLMDKQPVDVDAVLDKNLDDMAMGLARLKGKLIYLFL
ncbi:synaptosomal-associated protein 29 [Eurytemora carolleeae]|uniref:synaptosomal-associated protein 29 n=1 Tax=Eurytemora carolleeae TaxID=1294199 RepID=UPI000C78967B|nr:synaptosomal-associated protein 29 [Eurytemora carolleeae]|eukprot:XP_023333693.1 synaptosomal-associated protein 29-like [Eurytemora affinis]